MKVLFPFLPVEPSEEGVSLTLTHAEFRMILNAFTTAAQYKSEQAREEYEQGLDDIYEAHERDALRYWEVADFLAEHDEILHTIERA